MFEEPRSADLPTRIATAVCARPEIMKRVIDAEELCELHGIIQEEVAKALIFDKEPCKVGFFESFMHASYIDQMRCHVDEGGRLRATSTASTFSRTSKRFTACCRKSAPRASSIGNLRPIADGSRRCRCSRRLNASSRRCLSRSRASPSARPPTHSGGRLMRVTETEAKKCWCRHAMAPILQKVDGKIVSVEGIANRVGDGTEEMPRCVASSCMAWRRDGFENPLQPGTIFRLGSEKARELAGEPVGFCGAEPVRPR